MSNVLPMAQTPASCNGALGSKSLTNPLDFLGALAGALRLSHSSEESKA